MATTTTNLLPTPPLVQEDGPPPNHFDKLAIETVQHIASFIPEDNYLGEFRLICHATNDAVDADNCSFWRRRFLSLFEKPADAGSERWVGAKGNVRFKDEYQKRRWVLKNGVGQFMLGDSAREVKSLTVVRDLAVDSFSEMKDDGTVYESPNMAYIKIFLQSNDLLSVFRPLPRQLYGTSTRSTRRTGSPSNVGNADPSLRPTQLLRTLQVLCAPMMLSFEPHTGCDDHYGFPDSQAVVYATEKEHPIFHGCHGLDVNMDFVLHNLNFWKYHMLREAETTLFHAFNELEAHERPRWWSEPLRQGPKKLGKHWKGSYAFVGRDEIELIRHGKGGQESVQDVFAGENEGCAFQDMTLELVPDGQKFTWPQAFERHLRSLAPPKAQPKTRAQQRSAQPAEVQNFKPMSFYFEGEGQDVDEEFFASGWLNVLPPQQGVPGWQRLTMMKYFEDEFGTVDEDALWAYEGVVLPGGQIVVGRWWNPDEDDAEMYSGPFILWCVDGPQYEEESKGTGEAAGEMNEVAGEEDADVGDVIEVAKKRKLDDGDGDEIVVAKKRKLDDDGDEIAVAKKRKGVDGDVVELTQSKEGVDEDETGATKTKDEDDEDEIEESEDEGEDDGDWVG